MDRYVEVIGEGQFIETASLFIAEVTLEVRAGKDETALREVADLCAECLAILREAGIADDEIVEGGTDVRRPWYWKKQVGQNAARKVIIKVPDFGRLNRALEQLEPLQSRNKERRTISVTMRQPEFEDSADRKATAVAQAFDEAKAKALRLVAAMNCRLGRPLHVEEGGWARRNSGFSGDEDWGGDYSRFAMGGGIMMAAAGGPASEPERDLLRPTRTIFVKCRVRFAIEDE
jgi:uncharacterized protein YggE